MIWRGIRVYLIALFVVWIAATMVSEKFQLESRVNRPANVKQCMIGIAISVAVVAVIVVAVVLTRKKPRSEERVQEWSINNRIECHVQGTVQLESIIIMIHNHNDHICFTSCYKVKKTRKTVNRWAVFGLNRAKRLLASSLLNMATL